MEKHFMRVINCTEAPSPEIPFMFLAVVEILHKKDTFEVKEKRSFLLYGYNIGPRQEFVARTFGTLQEATDYFNTHYYKWLPHLRQTSDWLLKPLLCAGIYWRDVPDMNWKEIKISHCALIASA